jgi:hypothetical protein
MQSGNEDELVSNNSLDNTAEGEEELNLINVRLNGRK